MNTHLMGFSTSNYDAMLKFLKDFGFTISDSQLAPFFERGRAVRVTRDDVDFNLEESASGQKACFHLFLTGSDKSEIMRVKKLGYECERYDECGDMHFFRTPDGGLIVL